MIGAGASVEIRKPMFAAGPPFANILRGRIYAACGQGGTGSNESRVLSAPRLRPTKRMSERRLMGLSSMATRHILVDLARDYEASHGTRVEVRSMGGVEAAKSVRAGEAKDIVLPQWKE